MTIENAAHRFSASFYRAEFGPYGRSTAADISGAVERLLAETLDSSVRYDMPDPERDLWDEVWENRQDLERRFQAGELWTLPPEEETYGWDLASQLSETVAKTAQAFGLLR